ncbi:energy transduction protein TonB [Campylobacter pinnipediorum subsp. pinnipediorum]|uniref:energy transducer TonB n=1 Tax=Campylobacter pinnipediorum TaxID=1965231 RepID=UPI000995556B|nr:energy transducer TonB [Campylobacter pinnipediorum]AQW81549.1 energy transduction protein TonB [Campylobacter pinnipediorum subsp. pinnipediorum]
MRILQLQLSRSKKCNLGGFCVSALFHAVLFTALIHFHSEIKHTGKEEITKISLGTFNPAPIPPAPTPTPPAPPKPEPVKPEPVKPKPIEKPKPKKIVKKKVQKQPIPKPIQKPIEKQEEVIEETAEPQPTAAPSATNNSNSSAATSSNAAPVVGEFNFATSAGDERFSKIHKAIKKNQKYPMKARKMRKQGIVEVSFLLKKSGAVENIKVVNSSGTDILDDAAMKTIKLASKEFPILEKDYLIKIPMEYKLR